jgi:hypothetical protein
MKEVDSHEFLFAKYQKESNMEVLLVRMVGGVGDTRRAEHDKRAG